MVYGNQQLRRMVTNWYSTEHEETLWLLPETAGLAVSDQAGTSLRLDTLSYGQKSHLLGDKHLPPYSVEWGDGREPQTNCMADHHSS